MVLNGMFTIRLAQYREMAILSSKCMCVHKRIVLKNGPFLYGCQGERRTVATFPALLASSSHPYMDIRVNSRKPNLFKHRRPQPLHYDAYHSYYLLPQMRNKALEIASKISLSLLQNYQSLRYQLVHFQYHKDREQSSKPPF